MTRHAKETYLRRRVPELFGRIGVAQINRRDDRAIGRNGRRAEAALLERGFHGNVLIGYRSYSHDG